MRRQANSKPRPLKFEEEILGKRMARLRKEKGYTQVELARKMGLTQGLVSDYELGKLRPHPDIIIRLAKALEVTTDVLLGFKPSKNNGTKPSLKILRRMKKIEELPPYQQKILLKTIDTFLKGAEK